MDYLLLLVTLFTKLETKSGFGCADDVGDHDFVAGFDLAVQNLRDHAVGQAELDVTGRTSPSRATTQTVASELYGRRRSSLGVAILVVGATALADIALAEA